MDACDDALVISLGVQPIGLSAVPLLAIVSSLTCDTVYSIPS